MDENVTDNQNYPGQDHGLEKCRNHPVSELEKCTDKSAPDTLHLALELKEALANFRIAVQEAVDQRRSSCLEKTAGNTSGKPTLRKLPVRIREPAWVTSREAISLLKVSLRTLRRYRKQQLFTYKTVNGSYRYRYIDLVELMKSKASSD